jgi:hypothetical protein
MRQEVVLRKPPLDNHPLRELAAEDGICEATL